MTEKVNWALASNGATVSTNGGTSSGLLSYVNDGSDGSEWDSNDQCTTCWLKVDLGQARSIGYMRLAQAGGWNTYATGYKVEYSDDDVTYTQAIAVTQSGFCERINLGGPYLARYWKITPTSQGGTGRWYVTELELWDSCPWSYPYCDVSRYYSGNPVYPARIIDGNFDNNIEWGPLADSYVWIKVIYDTKKTCTGYRFKQDSGEKIGSYVFQVSDDNTNWTTVYTRAATAPADETISGISGSGKYFRIYTETVPGWWQVNELALTVSDYVAPVTLVHGGRNLLGVGL